MPTTYQLRVSIKPEFKGMGAIRTHNYLVTTPGAAKRQAQGFARPDQFGRLCAHFLGIDPRRYRVSGYRKQGSDRWLRVSA